MPETLKTLARHSIGFGLLLTVCLPIYAQTMTSDTWEILPGSTKFNLNQLATDPLLSTPSSEQLYFGTIPIVSDRKFAPLATTTEISNVGIVLPWERFFNRPTTQPSAQLASQRQSTSPLTTLTRNIGQFIAYTFQGRASWYGGFFNGRHSSNGEVFRQNSLTAAHRSLPFGTKVQVTNMLNGRQVIVRVTDRGPFVRGRVMDLSRGAAQAIGMLQSGVAHVKVDVLRLH